jgi:hypothetical protein
MKISNFHLLCETTVTVAGESDAIEPNQQYNSIDRVR